MSGPPEKERVVRQWLKKAGGDLKNAEHTLTLADSECPFDTVCFHAQQCVEKSLKALLTFYQMPFDKTHDLGQLLHLCRNMPDLVKELSGIGKLAQYAVESRYPSLDEELAGPAARREAEEALGLANGAHRAIRRRLDPLIG